MKLSRLTADLRTKFKLPDSVDGAVVVEVEPSSPAADKRIEPGDVIAMANDEKIAGPKDVQKQIDRVKSEGQKSILVVVNKASRRGDPHFLSLKLE